MPFFKSSYNIFKDPSSDEVFDENWMDSDKLVLPPTIKWDYSREMKIEDVDIWEVIYYQGGGLGLYAAWMPYAEFYMITHHLLLYKNDAIETYYGQGASEKAYKRAIELGMPITKNKIWVDQNDLWLYDKSLENIANKKIILP